MASLSTSFGGFFERSLTRMNTLRAQIDRTQVQIATGQRIERGSQDPAAAAAQRVLDRRARLGEAGMGNASQLAQDLSLADRELMSVTSLLQRARELAVAAANDPAGTSGRAAIAAELAQLSEELFALANAATPTGEPLFAGLASGAAFARNPDGSISYIGTSQAGRVPLGPGTSIERGLPGSQIFEFSVDGTPTNAFAVMATLTAAISGGAADPAAAAREALSGLDSALDSVSRAQTIIGARAVWVEMVQTEQRNRAVDLAERRSEVSDTPISEAIVRLQQSLTALEASQQAFARVSGLTLLRALS